MSSSKARMKRLVEVAKLEEERQRITRLARIVEEFLEIDLRREELTAGTESIQKLKRLLEENLWDKSFYPFDPDWNFDSGLQDTDNPDLCDPDDVMKADVEAGADTISYFHGLLKDFWDGFKARLQSYIEDTVPARDAYATSEETKAVLAQWGMEDFSSMFLDSVYRERTDSQVSKMNREMKVHYSFDGGTVHFYSGGVQAVHALMNLLNGLPVDVFGVCKDSSCGRWFIRTTKHERMFCSRKCAARQNQREKREADPKAYREYHRRYYRENLTR